MPFEDIELLEALEDRKDIEDARKALKRRQRRGRSLWISSRKSSVYGIARDLRGRVCASCAPASASAAAANRQTTGIVIALFVFIPSSLWDFPGVQDIPEDSNSKFEEFSNAMP